MVWNRQILVSAFIYLFLAMFKTTNPDFGPQNANVPEYGVPGQHDQAQPAPSHQDAEISKFSSFCQIRLHTICSLDTNDRFLSALWHFGHRESFQGKGFWDHSQPYHPPPFTSVVVPKEGGVVDGLQAVTVVPVVCRLGRALLLPLGL